MLSKQSLLPEPLFRALVAAQLSLEKNKIIFQCYLEVDLKSSEIIGKFWVWFLVFFLSKVQDSKAPEVWH